MKRKNRLQADVDIEQGKIVVRIPVRVAREHIVVEPPNGSVALPSFTRREREVFHLVRAGLTNKEIAARLGLAERTAKHYVSKLLVKLGFDSRRDILRFYGARETESNRKEPS